MLNGKIVTLLFFCWSCWERRFFDAFSVVFCSFSWLVFSGGSTSCLSSAILWQNWFSLSLLFCLKHPSWLSTSSSCRNSTILQLPNFWLLHLPWWKTTSSRGYVCVCLLASYLFVADDRWREPLHCWTWDSCDGDAYMIEEILLSDNWNIMIEPDNLNDVLSDIDWADDRCFAVRGLPHTPVRFASGYSCC